MLVEQLQKVSSLMEEVRGIGQEVEEKKKLQKHLKAINTYLDQTVALVVQVALIRKHRESFKVPILLSDVEQLRKILDEIELQSSVIEASSSQEIATWVTQASTSFKAAWQSNVVNETAELIKSLTEFAPLLPDENVASDLSSDLQNHQTQWPPTPSELASLNKHLKEANDLLGDLSVDEEIREFLLRVAANTAKVQHLNTRIINWLHEHHLESKLSVSFYQKENRLASSRSSFA